MGGEQFQRPDPAPCFALDCTIYCLPLSKVKFNTLFPSFNENIPKTFKQFRLTQLKLFLEYLFVCPRKRMY